MKNVIVRNHSRNLFAAACLTAGLAFTPSAFAQEAPTAPPGLEAPAAQTPAVDDQKLQSFTVAFVEVEKIKQEYTERLQSAATTEEEEQIRNEAGERMLQAVESTDGISVDEYNEIVQSAQADPEFAQRLSEVIQQTGQ
jgi:hypothetical protein